MPNPHEIINKMSWIQKQLDILRAMLRLQTMRERLETEIMVRRITRQYKVDEEILVATIKCESGMNPRAINRNADGTTDYGLCQFNDYWYKDQIAPQDALNKPELAVNVMCQAWEKGRAKDWVCFSNARYIHFLPKSA